MRVRMRLAHVPLVSLTHVRTHLLARAYRELLVTRQVQVKSGDDSRATTEARIIRLDAARTRDGARAAALGLSEEAYGERIDTDPEEAAHHSAFSARVERVLTAYAASDAETGAATPWSPAFTPSVTHARNCVRNRAQMLARSPPMLFAVADVCACSFFHVEPPRAWVHAGYCQGMSDLLSPFLAALPDDEAGALACFRALMCSPPAPPAARDGFATDGAGMRAMLGRLNEILARLDPHLHRALLAKGACPECLFAFRMALVHLRRELSLEGTCRLWECVWAHDRLSALDAQERADSGSPAPRADRSPEELDATTAPESLFVYVLAAVIVWRRGELLDAEGSDEVRWRRQRLRIAAVVPRGAPARLCATCASQLSS